MTDYLKNSREKSLEDASNVSEAELHATHDNIRESWERLQEIKEKILNAKQEASAKVDAEFADELKSAQEDYALMLTLTR